MSFKEWSKKQSDAKRIGDMLIATFNGCTEEEVSDIDFVINKMLSKYGEETIKWVYSLDPHVIQQGWDRFKRQMLRHKEEANEVIKETF